MNSSFLVHYESYNIYGDLCKATNEDRSKMDAACLNSIRLNP